MRITEKELYKMLERVNLICTRDLKLSIKKGECFLYEEYEETKSIFQITPAMSFRDMYYFLLGMKTDIIGWAI